MSMRTLMTAGLLIVAGSLIASTTFVQGAAMGPAENIGEQWKVAMQETQAAQKATDLKDVQRHVQRAINCIVGIGGPGFEGGSGNPCEGKGAGMMGDAKKAGGKYKQNMHWMDLSGSVAQISRKAMTVEMAKAAAWATEKVLEQTGSVLR